MSDLVKRIEATLAAGGLLPRNQSVLIAASGGVDSMVLLELLRRLARRYSWQLTVAHLNHGLRGRSSDADERLVRNATRKFRIPCVVEAADVRALAKAGGVSVEMAARQVRHEFLAKVARQRAIPTIALAHHADDQIELFFLRLLRGASPQGLAGMKKGSPSPADRTLTIIRPLLDCFKAELLEFATSEEVLFREDASNASADILRNRVRGELIPLLKRSYQPALSEIVLRNMEILRAESVLADESLREWMRRGGEFAQAPVALQRRILHQGLIDLGVTADFKAVEKLRTESCQNVTLSLGVVLQHDGQGRLCKIEPRQVGFRGKVFKLNFDKKRGKGTFDGLEWKWEIRDVAGEALPSVGPHDHWFDSAKVGSPVVLRHWEAGDRFQPIGLKGSAKIQDLFTNLKVPRAERSSRVVAVTPAGEIWWVEGLRIGEKFKLTTQTQRRLKWNWQRKPGPE